MRPHGVLAKIEDVHQVVLVDQTHPLPGLCLPPPPLERQVLFEGELQPFSGHLYLLVLALQFQSLKGVHARLA